MWCLCCPKYPLPEWGCISVDFMIPWSLDTFPLNSHIYLYIDMSTDLHLDIDIINYLIFNVFNGFNIFQVWRAEVCGGFYIPIDWLQRLWSGIWNSKVLLVWFLARHIQWLQPRFDSLNCVLGVCVCVSVWYYTFYQLSVISTYNILVNIIQ